MNSTRITRWFVYLLIAVAIAAIFWSYNTASPAREEMYKVIARQAAQLSRIVDDMLDISRVTRGEMQVDRAPIDLSDVVNHGVETAAPLPRDARIARVSA